MARYLDRAAVLLIFLLTLGAFLALFILRGLDDNALTSWQWVFIDADVVKVGAILAAGLLLAFPLSKVSLPGCHPGAFLFLSSFLISAMFWGAPEVIVDAARYFTQAKHLATYGVGHFLSEWGREVGAWTDLPLVPLLYGLVFRLWGESRVAIQVLTTLLFSGTVVLTYLTGKALWDERVGFYAGGLLLGMPYLLTQVPLMLVDVPAMFFFTLGVFGVIRALERGGAAWIALSSVAVACAGLSKYSTWLLLTVVPIIFLVYVREKPGAALRRSCMIFLTSLFLVGIFLLLKYDVVAAQVRLLQSYQVPGLRRWRESFASTFLFQIHPFITAAALWSVVIAFTKRDLKYAIIGWLLFLVVLLQVERIRYMLPTFPMLALMASYGLREIRSVEVRRFAVSCIVISSLVVAIAGYLPFLRSTSATNLKDAGEYLNSIEADTVEVFTLPQVESEVNPAVSVPLLDLFTRKRVVYRQGSEASVPPAEIETSPLRFSWEFRAPRYYAGGGREGQAVVIIAGRRDQSLPDQVEQRLRGYRLSRAFETADDWFQYQTLVRVYEGEGPRAGRKGAPWR